VSFSEGLREWGVWIAPIIWLLSGAILFWVLRRERKKHDALWDSYTEKQQDWVLWKRIERAYGSEAVARAFRAYQATRAQGLTTKSD
jgi:hypothetical protein